MRSTFTKYMVEIPSFVIVRKTATLKTYLISKKATCESFLEKRLTIVIKSVQLVTCAQNIITEVRVFFMRHVLGQFSPILIEK